MSTQRETSEEALILGQAQVIISYFGPDSSSYSYSYVRILDQTQLLILILMLGRVCPTPTSELQDRNSDIANAQHTIGAVSLGPTELLRSLLSLSRLSTEGLTSGYSNSRNDQRKGKCSFDRPQLPAHSCASIPKAYEGMARPCLC